MAGVQYESSNKLPTSAIRDVELSGDHMLETDLNGDRLLKNVDFKVYDS